jgi:hypothetical protein
MKNPISTFMASRTRAARHVPRTFPKFHEGMSTADYVRLYWGANARNMGIGCGYKNEYLQAARAIRDFFEPLNPMPAALLNGPEVLEESV